MVFMAARARRSWWPGRQHFRGSAYLAILPAWGNRLSPGELEQPPTEALACGLRATDQEHRIVAREGAEQVLRLFRVQHGGHGLGAPDRRLHDEEHADAFEA